MIVVTGGGGFIGSALIWSLNNMGVDHIVSVDKLGMGDKWKNLVKRNFQYNINTDAFLSWLEASPEKPQAIFHMGACSSTTERDADFLMENNVHYSRKLWEYCTEQQIPFIYASSAATYGAEESNFSDSHSQVDSLRPINKYGWSKQLFDRWVLQQEQMPPKWHGLKFFNVYGPQEYHKGSQASVVFHAFPQILNQGRLRLFKSYRPEISHGQQARDFVYIKDVVNVMIHLWQSPAASSGIYNLGTGKARTFSDLGRSVFSALNKQEQFDWIPMPDSIRNQYQYFTQADLSKLKTDGGYQQEFYSLEAGVEDYICQYLMKEDPFL